MGRIRVFAFVHGLLLEPGAVQRRVRPLFFRTCERISRIGLA